MPSAHASTTLLLCTAPCAAVDTARAGTLRQESAGQALTMASPDIGASLRRTSVTP